MTKGQPIIAGRSVYQKIVGGAIAVLIGGYLLFQSQGNPAIAWILIIGGVVFFLAAWRSVPDAQLLMQFHTNPSKTVAELIGQWQPKAERRESDYEQSLHSFLKSKLNFVKVTRQYGSARVKCDIAVGSEVFIELKKGLKSTNKLQRLIGQIELYRNEWQGKPVLIVFLGESEEDLLHDLNRSIGKYESVKVLTKNVAAPADADETQQQAASAT